MKRNTLTLLLVALVTVTFAQTPRHLRVLNYVPDSCYSLSIVNFDTLARVFELEAMHRENLLQTLYDSVKPSRKIVQSWIKRDEKMGVDFTASAAFVDSRYVLLPLNNERNFEKMIRSLDKSVPPFVTMTDPNGRKIRCMSLEDVDISAAVICTEDVACFALLTDLNAVYSAMMSGDYELANNIGQESPMQVWTRLSRSQFAKSGAAAAMMEKGWNSYTAYNQRNYVRYVTEILFEELGTSSEELQKALGQIELEAFSKGDVFHDRITAYSEYKLHNVPAEFQTLKSSPESLKKLMPYVSGDYLMLVISSLEGFGDLAKPFLAGLPQWQEVAPLMNKPFVFTASNFDEVNMQVVTLVDHPEEVRGMLERFVAVSNHIEDSIRKIKVVVTELDYPEEEVVIEIPDATEPVDTDYPDPLEETEDSTINMKTLTYKKLNGWDTYIITTRKRSMDYETYTWVVRDDSACVFVKDNLLFYSKGLGALGSLSQPFEHEWPSECFEHPIYARADFGAFVPIFGPDAAMPVRDMVCFADKGNFTMNINAVPGLRHGIIYEMVKYVIDVIK